MISPSAVPVVQNSLYRTMDSNNSPSSVCYVFYLLAYLLAGAPDIRLSAVYYFIAAIVVLLFAFVTIFLLHRIVRIVRLMLEQMYRHAGPKR